MRRAAVILAILLAAGAASAATRKPATPDGLRGQQSAAPTASVAPDPLAPATPASPPADDPAASQTQSLTAALAPDDGQCRSQCRRAYYFCLSGEAADSCPERWTSCETACGRLARSEAPTPN